MLGFSDDIVIICRSALETNQILEAIEEWTWLNGHTVNVDKTKFISSVFWPG